MKLCINIKWIFIVAFIINYQNVISTPLYLCTNFVDTRYQNSSDDNLTTIILRDEINIPQHMMSTRINKTFGLINFNSSQSLLCENGNKTVFTLPMTMSSLDEIPVERNKTTIAKEPVKLKKHDRLRGKIGPHFTSEGFLEYNHFNYNPREFCISRISDSDIEIELCSANCDQTGTLCIPKCCGIGEVMKYWSWTCQKASESWTPFLYKDVHTRVSPEEMNSIQIYYQRPYLNCTSEMWPFSQVIRPMKNATGPPDPGYAIRVLKDGTIKYLSQTRTWKKLPEGRYCVDGFENWGEGANKNYLKEDKQVIFLCPSSAALKTVLKQVDPRIDDLYAGVLYSSSIFILITVIVHLALIDKQNIHGLTILSQSISLFFFYISYGTVYFVAVAHRRKPYFDEGSPACLTLAIATHFFFLTTFSWLSVVNFDLYLTFKSLRPISKMSGKMRRFRLYSAIGWGVPFILISIFVFLDFNYKDYKSEVRVPDYGKRSCFVASWARAQYICSIISAIIPINLILIFSTFKIFYDFKQGKNGVMPKRAKGDKYSFKLFLKLFLIMGSIWSLDIVLCWFYNNGEQVPWYIFIIDGMMFLQALAIFIIFCCNRRTLKNLEDKFPAFKRTFAPIKRMLRIPDGNGPDMTDTTPNTPAGSRKMSTVSLSMEGTLERRKI